MKWQWYLATSLLVLVLWICADTTEHYAAKLWWSMFPRTALMIYRRHRNNHFNENVKQLHPVMFHSIHNVCAIDAHHVMRGKLYHTIYDDVFRGISACCAYAGNETPGLVTLTNASDKKVMQDVKTIFDRNQDFGRAPKTTQEFNQALLSDADSITYVHRLNQVVPDIQWTLPQPKVDARSNPHARCGFCDEFSEVVLELH
eukprot:m.198734 g.198734  ORF g.198734 m.198734 type:complete len:201 (-) comp18759_c0_seq1:712-1314(-)